VLVSSFTLSELTRAVVDLIVATVVLALGSR
jgi:type III secretory pathway component EscR